MDGVMADGMAVYCGQDAEKERAADLVLKVLWVIDREHGIVHLFVQNRGLSEISTSQDAMIVDAAVQDEIASGSILSPGKHYLTIAPRSPSPAEEIWGHHIGFSLTWNLWDVDSWRWSRES